MLFFETNSGGLLLVVAIRVVDLTVGECAVGLIVAEISSDAERRTTQTFLLVLDRNSLVRIVNCEISQSLNLSI